MTLDNDPKKRLDWIYNSQGTKELKDKYNLWANEYDTDVASYGYKIPAVLAGFWGRYLKPTDGSLLDAGAGTGIMGEVMALLGYKDLVAMDMSSGMLEIARRKGVYRELHEMEMGKRLDFQDNLFAGTTAVGVLSVGHAPPESFDELIRCTRSGGYVIFSVRTDAHGFSEKQAALEQSGKWKQVEATAPFVSMPLGEPNIKHRIFVYRVT
ncbi:MAG: class I SAM-dependent methyltransferase [Dehalococcoidales bacterium]|nr:class I SAM-dependent methyltransferase [Dehalococcoidales bacterium]